MKLMPFLQRPVSPIGPLSDAPRAFPAAAAMSQTPPTPVLRRRRKLWELDGKHHCPVIGTCVSIAELRKFMSRFLGAVDVSNAYEMHVTAVNRVSDRNAMSEAIHKHLDRKFRLCLLAFDKAHTDAEVMTLWREHLARGEVAGALWAAVTHRAISAASEQEVFTEIHMLSHQLGAGQAADNRRLSRLEKENAELKARLEAQKLQEALRDAKLRQQLREIGDERNGLLERKAEMLRLRQRLQAFESGAIIVDITQKMRALQQANEELTTQAQRAWALEKSLKAAHREAEALAKERNMLMAERDALQRILQASAPDDNVAAGCDGLCAGCELADSQRCILCVGGRHSLVSHYRALAERLGIRLIHHDGGVEESLSRLPDMIDGADAVLCPTDCVSHTAYYQVKRQCKRKQKPCLLFKGAGVSGFAIALARLTSGQSSLTDAPISIG